MPGAKFKAILKSDTGRGEIYNYNSNTWEKIGYSKELEFYSEQGGAFYGIDRKIKIKRDIHTTIDFELTETEAPTGYNKAEGTAKVSFATTWINYAVFPRNYQGTNYQNDFDNNNYTINVFNEKEQNEKLKVIVIKQDKNGNGLSGMKYEHAVSSSESYLYCGQKFEISKDIINRDGTKDYALNYFNWGKTHPMESNELNFSTIEFNSNVQFYFSETEAPCGYETLDSGIFFNLAYDSSMGEAGNLVVKKCNARIGKDSMTRNSLGLKDELNSYTDDKLQYEYKYDKDTKTHTITITIKNEELPKLKLKKVDAYTGLPVSGVKFKISANLYNYNNNMWEDGIFQIKTLEGALATEKTEENGYKTWEITTGESGMIYIILKGNVASIDNMDVSQLTIEEVTTQQRYNIDNDPKKNTFYLGYNYENEKKWFTNPMWYKNDILSYINNNWSLDANNNELTVKNDYQGFGLDLDITKVDEDGKAVRDAIFDYKVTSGDFIPFKYGMTGETECTYCNEESHSSHTNITTGSIEAYDGQCQAPQRNELISNALGKLDIDHITMYPKDGEHFGSFWILLKELVPVEGYKKLNDEIFLKFSHVKTEESNYRWKIEARLGDGSFIDSVFIGEGKDICLIGQNGEQVTIKNFEFNKRNENDPDNEAIGIKTEVIIENKWSSSPKDIVITKVDTNNANTYLPGAQFKLEFAPGISTENIQRGKIATKYFKDTTGLTVTNGYVNLEDLIGLNKEIILQTTNNNEVAYGKIVIEDLCVTGIIGNKEVIIFTEVKAPDGYSISTNKKVQIFARYNENNEMKLTTNYNGQIISDEGGVIIVPVPNEEIYLNLDLFKIDVDTKKPMNGVTFEVDLSNVISGTINNGRSLLDVEQIKSLPGKVITFELYNGQLNMQNLKFNGNNSLTIKEFSTLEGYLKAEGTITITWDDAQNRWISNYSNSTNKIYGNYDCTATESYYPNEKKVEITMGNYPSVNLGGKVWIDEQSGSKPTEGPDGIYNSDGENTWDILQQGVNVSIMREGVLDTTKTDAKGCYNFKLKEGDKTQYVIQFEYDGINYEAINNENISTGEENRSGFNEYFKTITKGKTNREINLVYYEHTNSNRSTLQTLDQEYPIKNNTNLNANVLEAFIMHANSDRYNNASENRTNVNCALQRRVLDLALETKVDEVKTTINGKESTYQYNGNTIKEDGEASFDKASYGLELYTSDYNYRISDYQDNERPVNKVNPDDDSQILNEVNSKGEELEAYVTYKIALKNQSSTTATINEVMVYYNNTYSINNVTANGVTVEYETHSDSISNYSKVILKPIVEVIGGNTQYSYITFKINKDENNNVILGDKNVIAEIISYSSDDGMIDRDSAPGNAVDAMGNVRREDDTDIAEQLKVYVEQGTREIYGNVWEESNIIDGNKEAGEARVKDVIVQLIEIKQIDNINFEYIWQEKHTDANGDYLFDGFIPGNYIVRFIYGDGTTEYVKKYNGYEYKSTIKAGDNSAVDNEARRLEVMAETVDVDRILGEQLRNKENSILGKTWMCAETDKFETSALQIYIRRVGTDSSTEQTSTDAKVKKDFGLAKCPETKITLEKHLKNLKITASNGKVLLDTANNVDKYLTKTAGTKGIRGQWKFETSIEVLQGATLEAEYEYTVKNESEENYTSEFLLEAFNNTENYKNTLVTKASEVKAALKNSQSEYMQGGYLGQYYYTGNNYGCAQTTTKVLSVQEYLNNNLLFKEGDFNVTNGIEDNGIVIQETVSVDTTGINTLKNKLISKDTTDNIIKFETLNKMITTNSDTGALKKGETKNYTAKLTKLLSPSTSGEELTFDSYLAEIMGYSTVTGIPDIYSIPGNLLYNHSKSTDINLESGLNELDEAWAERIAISNPTGQDKNAILVYSLVTISVLVVIAGGVVLIKKYIIK